MALDRLVWGSAARLWLGFGHGWLLFVEVSTSDGGVRLLLGASPMTCRSAGVWSSWACRATCPSRAFDYARSGVTLAPAFAFLGLVACQSAIERL